MDLQQKVIELETYIQNMKLKHRESKLKHREAARAHYRKKFKVTPDLYKENRIIEASYFWRSKKCRDTFPPIQYFE